ncbi:MAG TPA: AAA family ATPase [Candidatus Limnocylindrales bacterium]
MRITRLRLQDFGRHRDLDIELAHGFTIIRGPNEAGKSTIQRGLELALFRKATASTAELEALRSWGAAEDRRSITTLEFVVDDEVGPSGEGVVKGVLEKEFRGQRGRVSLELDNEIYTDPAKVDELIAEMTGIPTEAFFRSTASIRHEEMDDLDRDEGALRDRLQASIGGGDKGSSRARARLEDAIRALKARGDKNPGRLKIAEEAVTRAEQALKSGEAALEKLEKDRDALAQARDARLRAEMSLNESRNMLEGARQAERLRSDRAVTAERFERYRQAAEAQKRLQELEATPERSISGLRDQLERMRTLQSRVAILGETLHLDLGPEVEADEPESAYLSSGIITAVLLGVTGLMLSVGVAKMLIPVIVVGAAWLVVALLFAVRFWERRAVAMNVRRINEARGRDRTLRRQGRVGTEEGLRVAQSGVQNILRELGVHDIASAEMLLTGEQSRRQEIATLQVQVQALLAGQSGGMVDDLRDRAALEMEQKTAALDGLGPIANDARAREKLEAEARERHAALERARDAEAGAIARVDANPVDSEQVAGEAERLVTWQAQLTAFRRRVRIYEKTLAAIEASESGTMRKATRFLEQHVGRDISRLTGGRYRRVNIDDQTLGITVWAPERGDWVSASVLSKGTIDQVFLAARIGLVRLVTQGRRPPLVLDDPFVTFDDARAARAALLLREISSDFQVIYLACSNRYDGLADAVVELPGPAEAEPPIGPIASRTSSKVAAGLSAVPPPEAPAPPAAPENAATSPDADAGLGDVAQVPPRGLASSLLEEAQISAAEVAASDEDSAPEPDSQPDSDGPIQFAVAVGALRGQHATPSDGHAREWSEPQPDDPEAPQTHPEGSPEVSESQPEPGEVW